MIHVENESIQALFKQLESDYQTCLENDLDTKEELQKQKDFTNNFTALQEFLDKIDAPEEIKNQINEIIDTLKSWDVYAFWFKEMKDLSVKCKTFLEDFKVFAENNGIIQESKKESAKGRAPQKPTPPGMPATKKSSPAGKPVPQKPTPPGTPSLLKPIQRGVAPVQNISTFKTATTAGSKQVKHVSPEEPGPATETQGRKVPVLKPVFKHPPAKVPATTKPASATTVSQKSIDTEPIDEDSAPVPLKALVENKKLEIKVKPVKLIKPIMAVKHEESPIIDENIIPGLEAEPVKESLAKPAKPSLPIPVVEKRPIAPKGVAKQKPQTKPMAISSTSIAKPAVAKMPPVTSKSEKPLLIPKPIKIVVPDLGNIDLEDEISLAKFDIESPGMPIEQEQEDMFGLEEIQPANREVKLPPRRVKPIAVNVKVDRKQVASIADDNEDIVNQVAEKVTKRLNPEPKQIVVKFQSPEGEYITPAAIKPEDIEDLGLDEIVTPAKGSSSKKTPDIVTKLEAAEDWDDETISEILKDQEKDVEAVPPRSSSQKSEAPVSNEKAKPNPADTITSAFKTFTPPVTDKKGSDKKSADKKAGDKKGADKKSTNKKAATKDDLGLGIMDQEPQKTRLQDIKKPASGAPAEQEGKDDNPMSLFTGALQSKMKGGGKKSGSSSSSMPMFAGKAAEAPAASPRTTTSQAPIGSDMDIESLPETKDGLYQALIALEGKRYAIERAKKDLRADMDKGAIKPSEYENKVANLKTEMDKIGERIKEIREKIKKFK